MEQEQITKIEYELSELKSRARNIGYKNEIPRLPKKLRSKEPGLQMSVMTGFNKRLSNWKHGLVVMENPGGLGSAEKRETEIKASVATLAEHFNESK
jgi:hypothetical protein